MSRAGKVWLATRLLLPLSLLSAGQVLANGLPPPPAEVPAHGYELALELVVNGVASGQIVSVRRQGKRFLLQASDLHTLDVPLPKTADGWIAAHTLPGLEFRYDAPAQRFEIVVPPEQLPRQKLSTLNRRQRVEPNASTGAVMNYGLYATRNDSDDNQLSLNHETSVFNQWGTLLSSGRWQHSTSAMRFAEDGYVRYETTFQVYETQKARQWQFGDFISDSLAWSPAVRMGGIQWSKNFSQRPDLITYPLPEFSATAAVPSTVDLFINGYQTGSTRVAPGPFTLTDVPYINGAGSAVIITRNDQGRRVAATIPFYVTSELLQPGLSDYSLALGALRENFGYASHDYGTLAVNGVYQYGLTNFATLQAHTEWTDELALGGVGSVLRIGQLGVLDTAFASSQHERGSGWQASLGYQYHHSNFSLSLQHKRRSADYLDLASTSFETIRPSRSDTQAVGTLSLGTIGSLSAGYFDSRSARDNRSRLVNLAWSRQLGEKTNLFVSTNRSLSDDSWSASAQLIFSFGQSGTVSTGIRHASSGALRQSVNWDRASPSNNGLGWRFSYERDSQHRGHDYRLGELRWRNDLLELNGGFYGPADDTTFYGEAFGSIVAMNSDLLLSNRINDAFILVSTEGRANVPVSYENRQIGRTNAQGHRLIPFVPAWYDGHVAIDTLDLPPNLHSRQTEKRISVRANSGVLLDFTFTTINAAVIQLLDPQMHQLPLGSRVTLVGSGHVAPVGYDGQVYFEQLDAFNRLRVLTPDGRTCQVDFELDDGRLATAITTLRCDLIPGGEQRATL